MKPKITLDIISALLSILFIYAAMNKAMDYPKFLLDISKSPLLANFSNQLIAPVILGIEFLTAILLLIPPLRKLGLYAASTLMLIFTLYMGTLYFFYDNIPCSCGGILGMMSYPVHIVFNAIFTLISFAGILILHRQDKAHISIASTL